jgi:ApaG protein
MTVATSATPRTTSTAVTRGIKVAVESQYVPQHSSPAAKRYAFAYRVRITNESSQTVQLRTRHWVITHGDGTVEEVRGAGVVGEQPSLRPGQTFEYTSGCMLPTPRGTMHGSYRFDVEAGEPFDAEIARFALELPFSLN